MSETYVEVANDFVREISTRFGNFIRSIILYGSASRGDFEPEFSDLDFAVILKPLDGVGTSCEATKKIGEFYRSFPLTIGRPPTILTFQEFAKLMSLVVPVSLLLAQPEWKILYGEESVRHDLRLNLELSTIYDFLHKLFLLSNFPNPRWVGPVAPKGIDTKRLWARYLIRKVMYFLYPAIFLEESINVRRVDDILDEALKLYGGDVLGEIKKIKESKYICKTKEMLNAYEDSLILSRRAYAKIQEKYNFERRSCASDLEGLCVSSLKSRVTIAPSASEYIKEFVKRCSKITNGVESIILTGDSRGNEQNYLIIVLDEEENRSTIKKLLGVYSILGLNYKGRMLDSPLSVLGLTRRQLIHSYAWSFPWDFCRMVKYGKTIYGKNILNELDLPASYHFVEGSKSWIMNIMIQLRLWICEYDINSVEGYRTLVPILRSALTDLMKAALTLRFHVITTTLTETLHEFKHLYPAHSSILSLHDEQLSAIKLQKDILPSIYRFNEYLLEEI